MTADASTVAPSSAAGGGFGKAGAHPLEQMTLQLTQYLHDRPGELADGLRMGGRAPWQAKATPAQQQAYYRAVFAGQTPETPDALQQRIGLKAFMKLQQDYGQPQPQAPQAAPVASPFPPFTPPPLG